jgi:hypothetical protein
MSLPLLIGTSAEEKQEAAPGPPNVSTEIPRMVAADYE